MARELRFDGYWEGDALYSCDCCQREERFRFDSDDIDSKAHRAKLRNKKGWITTKVDDIWRDFCSEKCRNQFIRKNTI